MQPAAGGIEHESCEAPLSETAGDDRAGDSFPLTGPAVAAILFLLFAVGALFRLQHVDDARLRTPDERVYTSFAGRIAGRGLAELPVLVAEYNRDPGSWKYPPPMRAGYLVLLAWFMRSSGIGGELAGVWLSCWLSIATLALMAVIGARFLPVWAALYGTLALAVSVPDLVVARRCWQDSLAGALGLLLVWSACEIIRDHRRPWPYALFVSAGSFFAVVKELGAIVYALCALYVVALLMRRRAWKALARLVSCGLIGSAAAACGLILAAGGLDPLLEGWNHMRGGVNVSAYAQTFQNGPWYGFLRGSVILDPVNVVLAAFGTGAAILLLVPERAREGVRVPSFPLQRPLAGLFVWMSAALVAFVLAVPTLENFRYLEPVYGPMYLLGGIGLWTVLQLVANRWHGSMRESVTVLVLGAVLVVGLLQQRRFERVYVARDTSDLSIRMVLDTR